LKIPEFAGHSNEIVAEVERVIVGKRRTVEHALMTLLCQGHLLIEDIPGVGKTTLAKALAISIAGDFRRLQFTPDLLPSDITGSSVFNQKDGEFHFRPGPIFANVVLVDEINRATPKTQSALLEAMEEGQVTTDGKTRDLPKPFLVVATQNTVEMTGTYPLPEAQLDRFFASVHLGYPGREEESEIVAKQQVLHPLTEVKSVVDLDLLTLMQETVREVFVHDSVRDYAVDIVRATRDSAMLAMGASPRGSVHLMRASQAWAAMAGSEFVRPDDVKEVAPVVLSHRVIARVEEKARGLNTEDIVRQILNSVAAPVPVA